MWAYFVYVCCHVGLHRQSNCTYILVMPCVDNRGLLVLGISLILQPIIDYDEPTGDGSNTRVIVAFAVTQSLSKPENRTLLVITRVTFRLTITRVADLITFKAKTILVLAKQLAYLLTCLCCLRRRTRSITNERSPGCSMKTA